MIVTGMSGGGKSTVMSALEDVGFFVVDNLPPKLMLSFVDLMLQGGSIKKLAFVVDVRSREFFDELDGVYDQLMLRNVGAKTLFIDASNSELVKRFEKVRRPHPLQGDGGSILDAISRERRVLEGIKKRADVTINTSSLSIHDLARELIATLDSDSQRKLKVHILSFGFKHGLPIDAEFVFDVRWLPNPFWVDELREMNGNDDRVADFVFSTPEATQFLDRLVPLVKDTFSGFLHENKSHITVAFGCTGGKHRSVAFARRFAKELKSSGIDVDILNRDVELT
ncbi:MAG: RNase adapter RapZ [Candidatus Ancillula sp.]|nr:RNase adapter RapZ [Candidatus Ancillula sp.]